MTDEKPQKRPRAKVIRNAMDRPSTPVPVGELRIAGPDSPRLIDMPELLKQQLSPLVEQVMGVMERYAPEQYGYAMEGLITAQMRGADTEGWAEENRRRYPDPAKADKQMARERWEMATKVRDEYSWIWKPETLLNLTSNDAQQRAQGIRTMASSISQLPILARYLDQPGDEALRERLQATLKSFQSDLRHAYLTANNLPTTTHGFQSIG